VKRFVVIIPFFFVAGCAPHKPTSDAGTTQDAASDSPAKEAAACVPDFQGCTPGSSVCCVSTSVCNINTGVCQTVCEQIGAICTTNSQCCSGICNGTCE